MNDFFEIPPVPIEINAEGGDVVTVQPPSSWVGLEPVNVHLLSYHLREGQVGIGLERMTPFTRYRHAQLENSTKLVCLGIV